MMIRGNPDARRLAEKYSVKEAQVAPDNSGEFRVRVWDYIASHYLRASTHKRMTAAWETISEWLNLRNLQHPRQIRYEHAQDFMHWRKVTAMHNTARLELKSLSFILNEAIRREYCERNALAQAKVERQVPPEKPELSDSPMINARQALPMKRRGWGSCLRSWLISVVVSRNPASQQSGSILKK
jgi:hypothetical protein